MSIIVDWNGADLPRELKELPAGRYVVESVDEVPELTDQEAEGLRRAMQSVAEGRGVPADRARQLLDARAPGSERCLGARGHRRPRSRRRLPGFPEP